MTGYEAQEGSGLKDIFHNSKNNRAIVRNFLTINKYLLGTFCENFK